jgi:hypothetical protein
VRHKLRLLTPIALALAVGGMSAGAVRDQGWSGTQATWRDLETWSRPVAPSRELENGLGLHLAGSGGGVSIAFVCRVPAGSAPACPREVQIRAMVGVRSNPNILRKPTLTFLVDPETERLGAFDLSRDLVVDAMPGGTIQNGVGAIAVGDFLRLTEARTLSANVLGFDVNFRVDQIRALGAFAKRLNLR